MHRINLQAAGAQGDGRVYRTDVNFMNGSFTGKPGHKLRRQRTYPDRFSTFRTERLGMLGIALIMTGELFAASVYQAVAPPGTDVSNWSDSALWSEDAQGSRASGSAPGTGDVAILDAPQARILDFPESTAIRGLVTSTPGYRLRSGNGLVRLELGAEGVVAQADATLDLPVLLREPQTWKAEAGVTLQQGGGLLMENRGLTTTGPGAFRLTGGSDAPLKGGPLHHEGPGLLEISGANPGLGPVEVSGGTLRLVKNQWQDANVGSLFIHQGGTVECSTQTLGFFSIPIEIDDGTMDIISPSGVYFGRSQSTVKLRACRLLDRGAGDVRLRGTYLFRESAAASSVHVQAVQLYEDVVFTVEDGPHPVDIQVTAGIKTRDRRTLTKEGPGTLGLEGPVAGQLTLQLKTGTLILNNFQTENPPDVHIEGGALSGAFRVGDCEIGPAGSAGSALLPYRMRARRVRCASGSTIHVVVDGTTPEAEHSIWEVEEGFDANKANLELSLRDLPDPGQRLQIVAGKITGNFSGAPHQSSSNLPGGRKVFFEYTPDGFWLRFE